MAENSRMSKLSSKDDEYVFSWKILCSWDFMIGNCEIVFRDSRLREWFIIIWFCIQPPGHTETAHNRVASNVLGFKEALLEEAEKKKDKRK